MPRRVLFFIGLFLIFGVGQVSFAEEFDHSHARFTLILNNVVMDGKIDYVMLVRDPAQIEKYVKILGKVRKGLYENFTINQRIAYWTNFYNAATIMAISRNYPVINDNYNSLYPKSSVRQIPGIWNKMRFKTALGYKTLSQIQAEQINSFNEPLLYFAVVNSSVGGPKIMNEAINADKLESQLREAARNFVLDAGNVRADPNTKTLFLSKFFQWNGKRFIPKFYKTGHFQHRTKAEVAILHFLTSYAGMMEKMMIYKDDFTIKYMDYDWSLNER